MSSGKGFRKATSAIMKADALWDYNAVKAICIAKGLPVIEPKGKSAWKIEDATALMIKGLPVDTPLQLLKGLSFYASITTEHTKTL